MARPAEGLVALPLLWRHRALLALRGASDRSLRTVMVV
jgi:hypothetical protein